MNPVNNDYWVDCLPFMEELGIIWTHSVFSWQVVVANGWSPGVVGDPQAAVHQHEQAPATQVEHREQLEDDNPQDEEPPFSAQHDTQTHLAIFSDF